jgi:uncharacterized protein YktA (UPF0223 family)
MSHDSYFCEDTKLRTSDTRPFPTKWDGACWVGIWYVPDIDCRFGNPWRIWYDFRCPKECRPQKHQDWSTCWMIKIMIFFQFYKSINSTVWKCCLDENKINKYPSLKQIVKQNSKEKRVLFFKFIKVFIQIQFLLFQYIFILYIHGIILYMTIKF